MMASLQRAVTPRLRRATHAASLAIAATCFTLLARADPETPNIVFILCDDLGYGDIQALHPSGKISTPQVERLARDGMVFTDMHSNSSVCTPTRYGVLTGRYAWRTRLQRSVLGGLSQPLIEPDRVTIASLLRARGYHTACIGKWHLGLEWTRLDPSRPLPSVTLETPADMLNVDFAAPFRHGPCDRGFDFYFGISASLDMVPYTYLEGGRVVALPTEQRALPQHQGRTDSMSRRGPAVPGFTGYNVLPDLAARAVSYIDERAAQRKPFFLYLALTSPHTPILPEKLWQGRSGLNAYADFVMQTDAVVGDVLGALERHGMTKNTIVVFTSDNGCSPEANYEELAQRGHNPSAHFRGQKADIYEGGHRVPCVVRWPERIRAGSSTPRIACLTDWFATFADIVGAPLPDNVGEDSVSLRATLEGRNAPARPPVVHHSINGTFAIRDGRWKLVFGPGSGGWSAPRPNWDDQRDLPLVQLFDLERDPAEATNLQARHPEIVSQLTRQMESLVSTGRSTAGVPQANAVAVDFWLAGKKDHSTAPLRKRNP